MWDAIHTEHWMNEWMNWMIDWIWFTAPFLYLAALYIESSVICKVHCSQYDVGCEVQTEFPWPLCYSKDITPCIHKVWDIARTHEGHAMIRISRTVEGQQFHLMKSQALLASLIFYSYPTGISLRDPWTPYFSHKVPWYYEVQCGWNVVSMDLFLHLFYSRKTLCTNPVNICCIFSCPHMVTMATWVIHNVNDYVRMIIQLMSLGASEMHKQAHMSNVHKLFFHIEQIYWYRVRLNVYETL